MQPTTSNATLIKSTIAALLFGSIALVSFILPAEYNIDPTGIGSKLGLTRLAQAQPDTVTNDEPSVILQPPAFMANQTVPVMPQSDTIEVIVPPGKGIEYKFHMAQHAKMKYQWMTDGGPLYFDMHGEPEGDTTGYFESYAIATLSKMKGSLTTPFAGSHGWYWKNKTDTTIKVQLTVEGDYTLTGLKK